MSTDATTMQISGIPVIMYGMIGITTAVLAFVTLNSSGLITDGSEASSDVSEKVETPVDTSSVAETPSDAAEVSSEPPAEENVQQGGKKKRSKSKKNKSKSKSKSNSDSKSNPKCSKKHRHTKKCK